MLTKSGSQKSLHPHSEETVTKNWVRLLVGIKPKDTTKPKIGRRKDLLLAATKENTGGLSQSSVSSNSKIGEVLSYGYIHIPEGAWAVGRVQALVD